MTQGDPMSIKYNNIACACNGSCREENRILRQALKFYTRKPEYSVDEQGRRVTKFVPSDNAWIAEAALEGKSLFSNEPITEKDIARTKQLVEIIGKP